MTDEMPWPKPGEVLFSGDQPDWKNNACINFDPDAWHGYAEGFRLGSDVLVDKIIAEPVDQDFLVYPIVFGYRHSVELRLKVLARDLRSLLGDGTPAKLIHHLAPLWSATRLLLERAFPGENKADRDAAEEIILQLHKADPGSTAFRYPEDAKGNPSLAHLDLHINLRRLRDGMQGLLLYLDAAHSMTLVALDHP